MNAYEKLSTFIRNRQTPMTEAAIDIIPYLSILLVSHWCTRSSYERL